MSEITGELPNRIHVHVFPMRHDLHVLTITIMLMLLSSHIVRIYYATDHAPGHYRYLTLYSPDNGLGKTFEIETDHKPLVSLHAWN